MRTLIVEMLTLAAQGTNFLLSAAPMADHPHTIDRWDDATGENLIERIAGVGDYLVALATYRAAVKRWRCQDHAAQPGAGDRAELGGLAGRSRRVFPKSGSAPEQPAWLGRSIESWPTVSNLFMNNLAPRRAVEDCNGEDYRSPIRSILRPSC